MPRSTMSLHELLEKASGSPRYVGTISLSTTVATLAVTAGEVYMVQPDVDAFIAPSNSSGAITKSDNTTATLTTALGRKVVADDVYYLILTDAESYLAGILASGTGSAKVWRLV